MTKRRSESQRLAGPNAFLKGTTSSSWKSFWPSSKCLGSFFQTQRILCLNLHWLWSRLFRSRVFYCMERSAYFVNFCQKFFTWHSLSWSTSRKNWQINSRKLLNLSVFWLSMSIFKLPLGMRRMPSSLRLWNSFKIWGEMLTWATGTWFCQPETKLS